MSRQSEIIILDDSSDDDSEEELRIAKPPPKKKPKVVMPQHTQNRSIVRGDTSNILTREEAYLLQADLEDASGASAEEDDDYEDGDESFGDGSKAFGKTRGRSRDAPRASVTRPRGDPKSNRNKRQPRGRGGHDDSSDGESDGSGGDGPYRHSEMVKRMAQARAERAKPKVNGVATTTAKAKTTVKTTTAKQPRQQSTHKAIEVARRSDKLQPSKKPQPMTARKSAPLPIKSLSSQKRARGHDHDDDDDFVDESSAEEEEEDSSGGEDQIVDDSQDEASDSDSSHQARRGHRGKHNHKQRPATAPQRKKKVEERYVSSESDSEEEEEEEEYEYAAPAHEKRPSPQKTTGAKTMKTSVRSAASLIKPRGSSGSSGASKKRPRSRSSSRSPSPPPARAKPKTAIKKPPPPSSRPSPPSSPLLSTGRRSRAGVPLSESLSFETIQAQERELAFFRSQLKKTAAAIAATTGGGGHNTKTKTPSASSSSHHSNRKHERPHHNGMPKTNTQPTKSLKASNNKTTTTGLAQPTAAVRSAFSTPFTPTKMTTTTTTTVSAAIGDAKTMPWGHMPLVHNTAWRKLRFAKAPINLLPIQSHPSVHVQERELSEYDDTKTLESKQKVLSAARNAPPEDLLQQSYETQEDVTRQVRRVIDAISPVLKKCQQKRAQEIICANRNALPWVAAGRVNTSSHHGRNTGLRRRLGGVAPHAAMEISPIERVNARRTFLHHQKQGEPLQRIAGTALNRLVGRVRYTVGVAVQKPSHHEPEPEAEKDEEEEEEEDVVVRERLVIPETVIEIGDDLVPMRRACTWISVKSNPHVEDDPILRYVPYLGRDTRFNIDPKRYESTTLDKQQAMQVELPPPPPVQETGNDKNLPVKTENGDLKGWQEQVDALTTTQATCVGSALDDDFLEYLLCQVVAKCGKSEKVFYALKEHFGFTQPITDYDEIQERNDKMRIVDKRLAALKRALAASRDQEEQGEAKPSQPVQKQFLARLVADAKTHLRLHNDDDDEHRTTSDALRMPVASFDSNFVRFPEGKGLRRAKDMRLMGEWYRDLFCRRCYVYDCQQHGIQHPQPSRRMDPLNPVVKKAGVALKRLQAQGKDKDNKAQEKPNTKTKTTSLETEIIELDSSSSSSSSSSEDSDVIVEEEEQGGAAASLDQEDEDDEALASSRRSRRSQTRFSTMASASLQSQEVMVEKNRKKEQRKQRKQFQKLVRRRVDDSEYLNDSYREIVGETLELVLSSDPSVFCSTNCWKAKVDHTKPPTPTTPTPTPTPTPTIPTPTPTPTIEEEELCETDQILLGKLLSMLGGGNACVLARLLQDPTRSGSTSASRSCSCAAVYAFLQTGGPQNRRRHSHDDEDSHGHKTLSSSGPSSSSNSSSRRPHASVHSRTSSASLHSGGNNRELVKRTRMHRAQQQDKGRDHKYQPCDHPGACDASCSCLKRGHDCEKACACSRDCGNRHHGCKCAPGLCRTKNCACYASARECDPDFCFSCGAHEAAVLEFGGDSQKIHSHKVDICRNVNLTRGLHKKIGVAFSVTHGWGAFALEPIFKNEFVYEYTGALISDDEAERRGNIYDAMMVSFLFDINADQVVDAMRVGNKIKFANHRPQDISNLETKILFTATKGEHRIALFAKCDLQVGEELFFDYGYTNETAPGWSQVRAPHNTRCTVSEDEEEDDEDDVMVLTYGNGEEEEDDEEEEEE